MVTPPPSDASAPAPAANQPQSMRAYGRHRKERGLPGGNAVAVSRAIATQRLLQSVVVVGGESKILDFTLADTEWERNTDRSRAPTSVKEQAEAVTSAAVTSARVTTAGVTAPREGPRKQGTLNLTQAAAREKNARADLAELEFGEKAGKLVPAQDVEKAWTEIVTQVRTSVLSVPSKAKLAMPHLTHADLARLNDLLCGALEAIAEQKPASSGAAA